MHSFLTLKKMVWAQAIKRIPLIARNTCWWPIIILYYMLNIAAINAVVTYLIKTMLHIWNSFAKTGRTMSCFSHSLR
jgi:hypothetical protein